MLKLVILNQVTIELTISNVAGAAHRERGGCEHPDTEHGGVLGQAGHGAGLQRPPHLAGAGAWPQVY